jgi:hypothetical protein
MKLIDHIMLTFIVPVRHPRNSKDWAQARHNLRQTVHSISMQKRGNWCAVVVANHEADLPALPPGINVTRVDYPPNTLYERGTADKESFYNAVRIDKGRRVLAGMLHAGSTDYFMVVDDDDFVSDRLAGFVSDNNGANGWYLREGYVWEDGGRLLFLHPQFSRLCGTSHIIRADLYGLPARADDATDTYIKRMLGSHILIHDYLDNAGTPLAPLPFAGAVYRIGHSGAHSQSSGFFGTVFLKKKVLKDPRALVGRVLGVRLLTSQVRDEFFHQ